jgi:hypothetical protein
VLAPHVVAEAVFVMQLCLQVLEQSIEPSLSSENVVIAGGGMRLASPSIQPPF